MVTYRSGCEYWKNKDPVCTGLFSCGLRSPAGCMAPALARDEARAKSCLSAEADQKISS